MQFAFKKPVYCGDTIRCDFTITSIAENNRAEAKAVFTNQQNTVVLEAALSGFLPGEKERMVMAKMVAEGDPSNPIGRWRK
jgi:acyl dehydratase